MIEIRQARKNDTGNIAELMYSSGPEIYDFVYKTTNKTALEFIQYEFNTGRGFCGFNNVTVAVKDGSVVATGCFYDGKAYKKLLVGTLFNMVVFYGLRRVWKVLERSGYAGSVMEEPKKDELYLSNFGVNPKLRGAGVGSLMLKNKIEHAKNTGYAIFSLDVAETNPRAEALYSRLGMSVVKHKTFKGVRTGIDVPNARKMELLLSSI